MKKYIYTGAFLLLALVSFITFARFAKYQEIKSIEINQIKEIDFQNPSNVLLDVRSANEFKEGHISLAKNIDVMKIDFDDKILLNNKTSNYYVYCRSGTRSLKAYTKMRAQGFKNITNLEGGIQNYSGEIVK